MQRIASETPAKARNFRNRLGFERAMKFPPFLGLLLKGPKGPFASLPIIPNEKSGASIVLQC
jgi:hypothetical protein